jgi:probable rRNA maturation factor
MSDILIQRCVPAAGIPAAASLRGWAASALACASPHPANGSAAGPPLSPAGERGKRRRYAAKKVLGELTIRIVDETESRTLNGRYRYKDQPTNVLSFGYSEGGPLPADGSVIGPPLSRKGERGAGRRFPATNILGDLVICAPVVAREAREQNKDSRAHWAHMVVHGCLHLQGHDHENQKEAEAMEALEVRILEKLGFNNPYLET